MKLTKRLLVERDELIAENDTAKAEIDNRNRRIAQIDTAARETLGNNKTLTRCGFLLNWVEYFKPVKWKSEFIKVAGQEAAGELNDKRAKTKRLQITKF